jgi:hypothetical protein
MCVNGSLCTGVVIIGVLLNRKSLVVGIVMNGNIKGAALNQDPHGCVSTVDIVCIR